MKIPKNCIGKELNKPFDSNRKIKKRQVCVKNNSGKIVNLHYGQRGYSDFTIHKDTKRRARFRSRHNCSNKKNVLTPGYWACKDLW